MNEGLDAFLDDIDPSPSPSSKGAVITRDLLVFAYRSHFYAVDVHHVEGVIAWRNAATVPGADARVRGVMQDKGRIVVLMAHPSGRALSAESHDGCRIIVCATPGGHLGLPADSTQAVGPVELSEEPTPLATQDTRFGPLTFVDPVGMVTGNGDGP